MVVVAALVALAVGLILGYAFAPKIQGDVASAEKAVETEAATVKAQYEAKLSGVRARVAAFESRLIGPVAVLGSDVRAFIADLKKQL